MQIRYDLQMDHLVKFSRYHYRKTPAARRTFYSQMICWVAFVFVASYMFLPNPDPLRRVVPGLVGSLAVAALFPWLFYYSVERQVRKLYSEGFSV